MEIFIIIIAISLMIVVNMIWNQYRMKKISLRRGEPDICTYARSFDYRKVDTQIMREVFNAVQEWAGKYEGIPFPVKADDCFDELYKMDPDDLEDIYLEITEKLGISIDMPETNPYWDKVNNVKDLVMFIHYQKDVDKRKNGGSVDR